MQEVEVSLRVAMYYIKQGLTDKNVFVAIDGAQIKTGNTVHFDIRSFLKENGLTKVDEAVDRWQGIYSVSEYEPRIIIHSEPGKGDVEIHLKDGKRLIVESKKGKDNTSNHEYHLMREAIGQLMTRDEVAENDILAVAVPFSNKTDKLAEEWSTKPLIKRVGIRFILVKPDGDVKAI